MKKRIKVIILLLVIVFISGCGNHEITTGRRDYDASKIKFSCYSEESNEIKKTQTYADFLFNTKDKFQSKVYYKVVYTYNENISEEKFKDIILQLESTECLYGTACKGNSFNAGVTKYGWDTTVDKRDNVLIFTYYKEYGRNRKATEESIKNTKEDYIKNGFKCK